MGFQEIAQNGYHLMSTTLVYLFRHENVVKLGPSLSYLCLYFVVLCPNAIYNPEL